VRNLSKASPNKICYLILGVKLLLCFLILKFKLTFIIFEKLIDCVHVYDWRVIVITVMTEFSLMIKLLNHVWFFLVSFLESLNVFSNYDWLAQPEKLRHKCNTVLKSLDFSLRHVQQPYFFGYDFLDFISQTCIGTRIDDYYCVLIKEHLVQSFVIVYHFCQHQ
jgi:hypothetical protein